MKPLRKTADPKLLAAMEEIKTVLSKYDICAVAILSSPDAMEYPLQLEASWTCMKAEEGFLRFNSRPLPKDQKHDVITNTIGVIFGFSDALESMYDQIGNVKDLLGRYTKEISHQTRKI